MDTIQLMREAVVEALDTRPAIVALTGRASGNVVPFKNDDAPVIPSISYFVVSATPAGGSGNTWRVTFQFSAFAVDDDDATANALLEQVELGLKAQILAALPLGPVDAYIEHRLRRGMGEEEAARADLDLTFIVTN